MIQVPFYIEGHENDYRRQNHGESPNMGVNFYPRLGVKNSSRKQGSWPEVLEIITMV
jgi:hypothetical protein